MDRLGLVEMGWLVEGVFAVGGNRVRRAELAECMSICRATPTASRNRAIRWVGDNHVASLGDSFLCCSFLCLYRTVPEDSHCHMGGSDVVNPGLM